VPLNYIEDVWNILGECCSEISNEQVDLDPDDLMALSDQAAKGIAAPHTLKIYAHIKHRPAITLVDSGSSHNFISEHMAENLKPWTPVDHPMAVKVADGSLL
jgi:hypothetical protein